MADTKLKFIAEWIDKGLKSGTKEAEASLKRMQKVMDQTASISMQKYNAGLEEAAKKQQAQADAGKAWKAELIQVTAALAAAGVAIKKFYDFAKEGAQIELTQIRFDRLAQSIGTTANALDNQLYQATDGMLSQSQRMSLATDIVGLGLTKNADQTVRLAKVVSQLGADMNQVTLALTNQTTARFDQIGIAVAGFDDRLQGLIDSGMSAEDAFTEAFLQQGEAQIEKVGSVAETTAGKIMMLEASFSDLGDQLKVVVSQKLGPFLGTWAEILALMNNGEIGRTEANFLMLGNAVGIGRDKVDEMYNAMLDANDAAIEGEEDFRELGDLWMSDVIPATEDLTTAQQDLAGAMDAANLSLGSQIDKWKEQINFVDKGGSAFEEVAQKIKDEYTSGAIIADEATRRLTNTQISLMSTMGEFDGMSFDQIQRKLESMGLSLDEAALRAASIYATMQELNGLVADATVNIHVNGDSSLLTGPGGYREPSYVIQQAGGNFIVPPSFTGDSYPVRATAGERVQVNTASNTANDAKIAQIERRRENRELANMIAQAIMVGMK